MYILNEKGEKVKSNFFATDILSKIIQEQDKAVHESEAIAAFYDLLKYNEIPRTDNHQEWHTFKQIVCEHIRTNGSYQMSTNIVEGLCAVTKEGVMYLPQVQLIVKFLLGRSIDWFCHP